MKYKVTLESFPIFNPTALGGHYKSELEACRWAIGPIPGTASTCELSTDEGLGQKIWHGYLQMREEQKKQPKPNGVIPWNIVTLSEKEPEEKKFTEAINMFNRFMAGEGRDNFKMVTKIESIPELKVAA